MQYDPIKDRLGRFFSRHPLLQRLFYRLLDLFFLRAWYVRREVRRLLGACPPGRPVRVLDAGTGFGQYAYFMAHHFPEVHVLAVDVKEAYLENARRFFDRTPEAGRVTLACDDLTDLRAEGPIDFILSVDVMEHIDDDRAVFRHFARVLRPGGHVLVNTPSDLGGSDVSAAGEASFIEEHVRDGYNRAEPVYLRTAGGARVAAAHQVSDADARQKLGFCGAAASVLPAGAAVRAVVAHAGSAAGASGRHRAAGHCQEARLSAGDACVSSLKSILFFEYFPQSRANLWRGASIQGPVAVFYAGTSYLCAPGPLRRAWYRNFPAGLVTGAPHSN